MKRKGKDQKILKEEAEEEEEKKGKTLPKIVNKNVNKIR